MPKFKDLTGTIGNFLRIGLTGPRLKNNSNILEIKNAADTAFANIKAAILQATGNTIELNSNAAGTGADRKYTISRPSSGMTADVNFVMPTSVGSPGFALVTDGAGNHSYAAVGGNSANAITDTTSFAFGSTSPITMFTLPANAVVYAVRIYVDTLFNGTPSLSIGISGNTSKYVASTQLDLAAVNCYEIYPSLLPVGTSEALIATYAAGSATAGAGRVEVDYSVPA